MDIEKELLEQVIAPIVEATVAEVDWEEPPPGSLAPPPNKEKLRTRLQESLMDSLVNNREREFNTKGFDILIKDLPHHPAGSLCEAELREASKKAVEVLESLPPIDSEAIQEAVNGIVTEDEKAIYQEQDNERDSAAWLDSKPLIEQLGISQKSYETMYEIGIGHYERQDFESACSVFQFLTTLNAQCHEVWHSCGLCYQSLNFWDEAISSFSIAILTNPANIHSFSHLANCYREINKPHSADEVLALAEELLDTEVESVEEKQKLLEVIQVIKN